MPHKRQESECCALNIPHYCPHVPNAVPEVTPTVTSVFFKCPPFEAPLAFSVEAMHIFIHERTYICWLLTQAANSPLWLAETQPQWLVLRKCSLWSRGICFILNDQHPDLTSKSCLGGPSCCQVWWAEYDIISSWLCTIWTCLCSQADVMVS